ncbi:MAG: hypothetical protein Q7R81_03535 [Candidatus Peregrinibacteria bacterium]|nr:hypothetical protein [Candidatus Peregrinibacteria bacterium]
MAEEQNSTAMALLAIVAIVVIGAIAYFVLIQGRAGDADTGIAPNVDINVDGTGQ